MTVLLLLRLKEVTETPSWKQSVIQDALNRKPRAFIRSSEAYLSGSSSALSTSRRWGREAGHCHGTCLGTNVLRMVRWRAAGEGEGQDRVPGRSGSRKRLRGGDVWAGRGGGGGGGRVGGAQGGLDGVPARGGRRELGPQSPGSPRLRHCASET